VPRGTRVRVTAMLRGGARDAMLTDGRDTVRFPASANGAAVSAILPLDHDGSWSWIASATPQADAATLPPELPDALAFTVVPDKRPAVAIVSPASDTAIGPTGIVPVYVDASDDHGVSNVSLQVWRESAGATGATGATTAGPTGATGATGATGTPGSASNSRAARASSPSPTSSAAPRPPSPSSSHCSTRCATRQRRRPLAAASEGKAAGSAGARAAHARTST
jgi:hypothetical protein